MRLEPGGKTSTSKILVPAPVTYSQEGFAVLVTTSGSTQLSKIGRAASDQTILASSIIDETYIYSQNQILSFLDRNT